MIKRYTNRHFSRDTDKTDHATPSVTIGRIYVRSVLRCGLEKLKIDKHAKFLKESNVESVKFVWTFWKYRTISHGGKHYPMLILFTDWNVARYPWPTLNLDFSWWD